MTASGPRWPAAMVWAAAGVMFVLHQDFWLWSDRSLVLGFLPIGLAYHAGFSLAAATLWAVASRFAWPDEIERWAESDPAEAEAAR